MDPAEAERTRCGCGKWFTKEWDSCSALIYGNLAITACSYYCAVSALAKHLEKERAKKRGLSGFGRRRT